MGASTVVPMSHSVSDGADYAGLESIGPYRVIDALETGSTQRLVLDTNVAIDIERFYFGSGHVDRPALRALLDRFPAAPTYRGRVQSAWELEREADMNYGWAIFEATFTRTGQHDAVRARRMRHAMQTVLRWDPNRLDREFKNRHPPVNRDSHWPRVALPLDDEAHHPGALVGSAYGALLYLCKLDATRSRWRSRPIDEVFSEFYAWISDELGVRGAYEIAAGIDFLVGSPKRRDGLRKMLKLGGGETADGLATKAWNAAWDLQFLRLTDSDALGLSPANKSIANTALVTRNIDPWLVRTQSRIRMVVNGKPYVFTELDDETNLTPAMKKLIEPDFLVDHWRSQREPEATAKRLRAAVHALEADLGVSEATRLPPANAE